jgi:aminopeptidase-like protein
MRIMFPMLDWARDLYKIPRSITGDGVRRTLEYLSEVDDSIQTWRVPTGMQVFDWTVPKEWVIREAFIEHESGRRFAEWKDHNLHLVNYSVPIDSELTREELVPHIITIPEMPDAIPYATSYYAPQWGFCMAHHQLEGLPAGKYRVLIDSEFIEGELVGGEALVAGKSGSEILFSTNICHPQMVNNELSGPVVQTALLKYLRSTYPNPRFSYRFVFTPETIGALSYISLNLPQLRNSTIAGFVLSCVGDEKMYSAVSSRSGDSLADDAILAALHGHSPKVYSYLDRASDERQYCAPGIDLPVCGFSRSRPGAFTEYHTSCDDFDLVTEQGLEGSFAVLREVIDTFEGCLQPRAVLLGEPQMSRRGMYPETGARGRPSDVELRMDILAYASGSVTTFKLSELIGRNLRDVNQEVRLLLEANLLEDVWQGR